MESRRKPGRDGRDERPDRSEGREPGGKSRTSGSSSYSDYKRAGSRKEKSEGSEGRSYGKPFRSRDDNRGGDKPENAERKKFGNDRFSGGDKPFRSRTESDSDKPSFRDKKPYNSGGFSSGDRPFRKSRPESTGGSSSGDKPFRRSRPESTGESAGFREKKSFGDDRPRRRRVGEEGGDREPRSFERKRTWDKPDSYNAGKPIVKKATPAKADDGKIRLNKFIAASGVCSRREADDMISAGLVSINGEIVTVLGTKILPTDDVRYNGERLKAERHVYILLNKPKDYVTTTEDPHAKRTVLELIEGACKERVYPVGRLDRNTTGVLLLTNDGDLAKKLMHPSHNRKKIYQVQVDQNVRPEDLKKLCEGFELEDGFIKADEASFVDPIDKKQIGVEIHSGRNRIVRRMLEHLEFKVLKLDRVYFSGLTKKGLQRGHWRFLTTQEVAMLKMGSYE